MVGLKGNASSVKNGFRSLKPTTDSPESVEDVGKITMVYWKKESKQYSDGVPHIKDEERAELIPYCRKHGALLAYKHGIYRCIECGFAVKYDRSSS